MLARAAVRLAARGGDALSILGLSILVDVSFLFSTVEHWPRRATPCWRQPCNNTEVKISFSLLVCGLRSH